MHPDPVKSTLFNTASSAAPSDSTVWEDAGFELRHWQFDALTIWLDLIHIRNYVG